MNGERGIDGTDNSACVRYLIRGEDLQCASRLNGVHARMDLCPAITVACNGICNHKAVWFTGKCRCKGEIVDSRTRRMRNREPVCTGAAGFDGAVGQDSR